MKLYASAAPNPRRVLMFLAEKGIEVPIESVNMVEGEHRSKAFLAKNPLGALPVLEFDDGTCLSESFAIMSYLEDLNPDPPLIGKTAVERANTIMWDRRMETELLGHVGAVYRHTSPFFAGRVRQIPEVAEDSKARADASVAWLNTVLGERAFVAGNTLSIADFTAYVTFGLGTPSVFPEGSLPVHVSRWLKEMGDRPSATV